MIKKYFSTFSLTFIFNNLHDNENETVNELRIEINTHLLIPYNITENKSNLIHAFGT